MTPQEKVIQVARAEVGYLEKASDKDLDGKTANAGTANHTKYARDLDALGTYNGKKCGYAWCDVFVDWCFVTAFGWETALKMLNQGKGSYGAGCTSSANYYKAAGRFHTTGPQPGDQIFFTADGGKTANHTGLVVEVKGGRVYAIEGNTSGASGVVANGGGVCAKSYALTYKNIYGYGRPDWDLVATQASVPTDKVEMEDDDAMDVIRFKELWNEMRKDLQDNDKSEYSEAARKWATTAGLIAGNGTEIDGEPNYMWEDILTREQLIIVLYRFAKMMGKA